MIPSILCVLLALVLITWATITLCPSLAKPVLGNDPPDRLNAMDGLRGILAICVFMSHCILARSHYAGTGWVAPPGNFVSLLGQTAVALFFMISAYLFWGRILAKGGALNWREFYKARFLRLAPMFYTSVLLLFILVAFESNFTLHTSLSDMLLSSFRWMLFSLAGSPDINGIKDTYTIHSTVWTLKYEWIFYFALPVLAYFYRKTNLSWPIYLAVALYSLRDYHASMYGYFVTGSIALHILNREQSEKEKIIWMIMGLIGLAVLGHYFKYVMGSWQTLLILPVFIASLQTRGPWRVLQIKPLRFLGHISYSFYLLHNLMIYIYARWITGFKTFNSLNDLEFYLTCLGIGLTTIIVSTLTFLMLEKPFFTRRVVT